MKTKNLERYLNSFAKHVVMGAKKDLQQAKGAGTDLEKSISFKIVHDKDGFVIQFYMADYGEFVDKGVSGNSKNRSYTDYKGVSQPTPYKYKQKQPPPGILAKWISKKKIKGRDKKTGRFISNMSLAYIIGRSIKKKGIPGLSFFQKPLGLGLSRYGKNFLKNLKEDILDGITTKTIKA
jgi:hypothetical protein